MGIRKCLQHAEVRMVVVGDHANDAAQTVEHERAEVGSQRDGEQLNWAAPPSCHGSYTRSWTRTHAARPGSWHPAGAPASPNAIDTAMTADNAEMIASVQMAR